MYADYATSDTPTSHQSATGSGLDSIRANPRNPRMVFVVSLSIA
jgi:hypothetical protein